jgi:tRNA 2-thiouridine synthesizing protein A
MKNDHFSETLDVTGHKCPIPVLRLRRQLEKMPAGAVIKVTATDSMTGIDFPHFCRESHHELLEMTEEDGILYFLIKKSDTVKNKECNP